MKDSRLVPGPGNTDSAETSSQKPVDRGMYWYNWLALVLFASVTRSVESSLPYFVSAKAYLEKLTRFWPLTIGETIIFNMLSVSITKPIELGLKICMHIPLTL